MLVWCVLRLLCVTNKNVLLLKLFLFLFLNSTHVSYFFVMCFLLMEDLMEAVKLNSCLYDKKDKSYKNKIDNEKAWNTIALSVNKSGLSFFLNLLLYTIILYI